MGDPAGHRGGSDRTRRARRTARAAHDSGAVRRDRRRVRLRRGARAHGASTAGVDRSRAHDRRHRGGGRSAGVVARATSADRIPRCRDRRRPPHRGAVRPADVRGRPSARGLRLHRARVRALRLRVVDAHRRRPGERQLAPVSPLEPCAAVPRERPVRGHGPGLRGARPRPRRDREPGSARRPRRPAPGHRPADGGADRVPCCRGADAGCRAAGADARRRHRPAGGRRRGGRRAGGRRGCSAERRDGSS